MCVSVNMCGVEVEVEVDVPVMAEGRDIPY
jgi:hypothetical protein